MWSRNANIVWFSHSYSWFFPLRASHSCNHIHLMNKCTKAFFLATFVLQSSCVAKPQGIQLTDNCSLKQRVKQYRPREYTREKAFSVGNPTEVATIISIVDGERAEKISGIIIYTAMKMFQYTYIIGRFLIKFLVQHSLAEFITISIRDRKCVICRWTNVRWDDHFL